MHILVGPRCIYQLSSERLRPGAEDLFALADLVDVEEVAGRVQHFSTYDLVISDVPALAALAAEVTEAIYLGNYSQFATNAAQMQCLLEVVEYLRWRLERRGARCTIAQTV